MPLAATAALSMQAGVLQLFAPVSMSTVCIARLCIWGASKSYQPACTCQVCCNQQPSKQHWLGCRLIVLLHSSILACQVL
jgi:hypothetical protein